MMAGLTGLLFGLIDRPLWIDAYVYEAGNLSSIFFWTFYTCINRYTVENNGSFEVRFSLYSDLIF